MKVCFETFGCRLNKAEALQMEADYLARGWETTNERKDADLIVVRGCSVTSRAQADCERLIAHLRRNYPLKPVRVCGCIKSGNTVFKHPSIAALASAARSIPETGSAVPTRTARAYLKVQDGCSGKCTFCIVPKFRGKSTSIPFFEVLDKAKRFIDSGYHEIVVTGCNLSLFASDGKRLPELLTAIAELSADCRVRLGSLEPGACAIDTVHAIAEHDNICRFLHIPVQSGSAHTLSAMKRPYLVRDIDELVKLATRLMPDLGLGCDMLTGFPGESELDFSASRGLLSRLPFNNIHAFPYSTRPGTPAAAFEGALPPAIRSARAHELNDIVQSRRIKFARGFIGKTVEIVVEHDKKVSGWTGEYLKCEAVGAADRKSIVKIFVTRTAGDRLFGRLVAK